MSFTRQRSDRPDPARRRQVHTPELLESRQLLSGTLPGYLAPYTPSDLYVTNPTAYSLNASCTSDRPAARRTPASSPARRSERHTDGCRARAEDRAGDTAS